jgi:hypothetical protein
MQIWVYSEQTTRSGQVCTDQNLIERESGDINFFGAGTEHELISMARERLATRLDKRPGGASDKYAHECARQVLRHLGANPDALRCNPDGTLTLPSGAVVTVTRDGIDAYAYPDEVVSEFDAIGTVVLADGTEIS